MSIDQLAFPDDAMAPGDEPDYSAQVIRDALRLDEPALDLSAPYASAAPLYLDAGWSGVLPLPPGEKSPPPGKKGSTEQWTGYLENGDLAPYPSRERVELWRLVEPQGNVALRAPDDVIFLDVDNYGVKRGGETLVELSKKLGALPRTWRSSARGPKSISGIYPYRVPAGRRWIGGLPDIEILQPGHRYAVVWPSTNPHAAGALVEWYPPGEIVAYAGVPKLDELPELPAAWVSALTSDTARTTGAQLVDRQIMDWLKSCREYNGQPCGKMRNHIERSVKELTSKQGSRHDTFVRVSRSAVAFAGEGHAGVSWALTELRRTFVAEVTRPGAGMVRDEGQAIHEVLSAIHGAVRLAAARHPQPETYDPDCLSFDDELPAWIGPVRQEPVKHYAAAPAPSPVSNLGRSKGGDTGSATTGAGAGNDGNGSAAADDNPPEPPSDGVHTPSGDARPALDVSNPAVASDWLREAIGRGRLAGIFKRGDASSIVHTPAIGEDGYRQLADERDDDGPAQVQPFSPNELAARLQFTYSPYRQRESKEKNEQGENEVTVKRSPAMFPLDAARRVLDAPDMLPNVRRLAGVVHTPAVRADGSLIDEPGYDERSRLLHLPEPGLVIPRVSANPTARDVGKARELLLHLVADFPFVSDHDRAAYLGLLITPLLRDLAPSPYKMFAISAHQAGSGKTLLATLARIIHGGVFRAEMPEDDAELRKQITTILNMTTGPVVNIDNVTGVVRSSTLAGLLTSSAWDDRKLGVNDLARCVNDRVWVLTGNNMALGGDLVRRTIWVQIDPGRPDPQLRQNFKIVDIEDYVSTHRGEILAALLTLVRAWVAAGKPGERMSSDGYARWLHAVNGVLAVADIAGQCDAPEARGQDEGSDDEDWGHFLAAIERVFDDRPWSARELLTKVDTHPTSTPFPGIVAQSCPLELSDLPHELAERLAKMPSGTGPTMLGRSLGKWLANRRGRWSQSLTVREAGSNNTGKLWRIERYQGS